jgi:hypothetical protein
MTVLALSNLARIVHDMPVRHALLLACVPIVTTAADALRVDCTLGPESTYQQVTLVDVPVTGGWIGDHDATVNPGGTRTLPGLFGGSGNVAIPYTGSARSRIVLPAAAPLGSFTLWIDETTAELRMSSLSVDALAGRVGSVQSSLVVTYGNFRTVSPTSTFPGAANLGLPLENGVVTAVEATQTGEASTTAVSAGMGLWDFALNVPIQVRFVGLLTGEVFETLESASLTLVGRIDLTQASPRITGAASVSETVPVPPPDPLVHLPMAVPTILPPGATANLLVSGTFSQGSSTTTASANLQATGRRICPIDFDASGVIDFGDLTLVLLDFGPCDACLTDVDRTGEVDYGDLVLLLLEFGPCGG